MLKIQENEHNPGETVLYGGFVNRAVDSWLKLTRGASRIFFQTGVKIPKVAGGDSHPEEMHGHERIWANGGCEFLTPPGSAYTEWYVSDKKHSLIVNMRRNTLSLCFRLGLRIFIVYLTN